MVNLGNRLSVYIVEDEENLTKGICGYFTSHGIAAEDITSLPTLERAEAKIKDFKQTFKEGKGRALWLIDIALPDGSGFHLLDSFQGIENYEYLQVVVITADQSIDPGNLEKQYPFRQVLLKPFGIQELDIILNNVRYSN